jgi:hypothetical protein
VIDHGHGAVSIWASIYFILLLQMARWVVESMYCCLQYVCEYTFLALIALLHMGRLDLLPFVVNGLMGVCSICSSPF